MCREMLCICNVQWFLSVSYNLSCLHLQTACIVTTAVSPLACLYGLVTTSQVNTTMKAGVMVDKSDTVFDGTPEAVGANAQLASVLTFTSGKDSKKFATAMILNNLQSMGYTKRWLSYAYDRRNFK